MARALPFSLHPEQLECIKVFALVCMLVSHTGRFWFRLEHGWPLILGQLAFPLFAFCVAVPLARDPERIGERMAFRLFPYAVLCQVLVQPIRGDHALNVLFLYLAVGAWFAAGGLVAWRRWFVRAVALSVALHAAFWWPGFLLVVSLTRWVETRRLRWLCLAGLAFLCVALLEGRWFGFAAALVVPGLAATGWRVPRVRGLFARAYVGQYGLYWALKAVLR